MVALKYFSTGLLETGNSCHKFPVTLYTDVCSATHRNYKLDVVVSPFVGAPRPTQLSKDKDSITGKIPYVYVHQWLPAISGLHNACLKEDLDFRKLTLFASVLFNETSAEHGIARRQLTGRTVNLNS